MSEYIQLERHMSNREISLRIAQNAIGSGQSDTERLIAMATKILEFLKADDVKRF